VGYQAGYAITTADRSTIVGTKAADNLTTGGGNVVVGYHAMGNATTADLSTVVGYQAGEGITTGARNTMVGVNAGAGTTTGTGNTFIGGASTGQGNGAGKAVTTGSKNTILGTYDGNQGGLDIRTASNNIVLSDGDGNPRVHINSQGTQINSATAGGGNALIVYNNSTTGYGMSSIVNNQSSSPFRYFEGYSLNTATQNIAIYTNGDVKNTNNSYGAISDIKLKQDIVDAASQWDDIKAIQIRKYRFKSDPNGPLQLGVIAQEVEQVSSGLIEEHQDELRNEKGIVTGISEETTKSVKYSILYMKAVKALQEAMDRIETLEAKVTALEG
jgi:hypothetical protein